MIDLNEMRGRAQYCAERAEKSVNHEMREHWRHASDAWLLAAGAIQETSRIIDEIQETSRIIEEWNSIKSSQASRRPPV
jgi:hypothetical protein